VPIGLVPYNIPMLEKIRPADRRRILRTVLGAGAVAFIFVWWLVPPLLYQHVAGTDDGRLKAITDTRTALLAGLVGLGALGTFWLNSRVYRITARTFEVTERGHLTDRYAKAIEQLGSDSLDVRLGGIYALEQIARDSPRDQDQATIVEVLSAFVRVHSDPMYRLRTDYSKDHEALLRGFSAIEDRRHLAAELIASHEGFPVDLQAAVSVLGRLPQRPDVPRGNLSGAHLPTAQLMGAELARAVLVGVNLSGATLMSANLSGAALNQSNLSSATLNAANLSDATLFDADLTGAWLIAADLSRTQLHGANLAGARVYQVNLTRSLGLDQNQIDVALGDVNTKLPPKLRRPTSWLPP
jgi:hypothetical protein